MKKFTTLLALSLAANAAFLVTFFVRPKPVAAPATGTSAPKVATNAAASATEKKANAAALERTKLMLSSNDLPQLVADLRAAGFPPAVIRAIVSGKLSERTAAKLRALFPDIDGPTNWKTENEQLRFGSKRQQAASDLMREQQRQLRELLGGDEPDSVAGLLDHHRFGNIPADKVAKIRSIESDYNDLQSQLQQSTRGVMLPADREKMAFLEKEKRADLEKMLTPQELREYDMRTSQTAMQLRYQLATFNPTNEEYGTLYDLQSNFDQQFKWTGGSQPSPDWMQQRASAAKQLQGDIAAALGPDRYAEYQRSIDGNYQQLDRVVARLELPDTVRDDVWAIQQSYQKDLRAIQTDRTLSPDQRNARMSQLNADAVAKATSLMGKDGVETYRQSGGWWLNAPVGRNSPGTVTNVPAVQLPVH